MSNAVAFLRGMNVGGHRITNDDLIGIVGDLGLDNVSAYQASGNMLFDAGDRIAGDVEDLLEAGLESALGYPVPTIVRTAPEIRAVLALEPHTGRGEPVGKPQVVFLKRTLSSGQIAEVEALIPDGDLLAVVGRELHWWPNGGVSESTLDWAALDRAYGPLTMRTRATIERIEAKLTAT